MQSAVIAAVISVALVTWLPDAARAMRESMLGVTKELHKATGGGPLILAEDGGN